MIGNDTSHNGRPAEAPLSPREFNQRVVDWSIQIAAVRDVTAGQALEARLADEPEAVRTRMQPRLQAKLAELDHAAQGAGDDEAHVDPYAWVPEAVRAAIHAAERVKAGHAGATGLVPLGFMRDGGAVLVAHRVVIRDQFKGNRAGIFGQSGKGKTNLVKVVLFWVVFNPSYGKLIFDFKGEYVPWTQNERGEDVPGLCEHPLAKERIVLYTTKQRHLHDADLRAKVTVRPLKIHLRSILPRDFALFWPNLTKAQEEFLFTYDEDPSIYELILGEEKDWHKLGAWFGEGATRGGKRAAKANKDGDEEGADLEASGKRVVRNIRKKLQAAQKRSYIVDGAARIEQDPDGRLQLHTPYDSAFVDALKAAIPVGQRSWNNDTKTWSVAAAYRATAEQLIANFFGADTAPDSLSLIGQDLAAGKLVVVDFSGIASDSDRGLIATLVTRRQFEHNLERIDLDEGPGGRVPFVAFFEEAQNLLGADKLRDSRNAIFIRTFKEGRALAIGTTSITQQPGALARDLTSQISYYIVQHLRARDDIRDLVAMDPALEGAESDIARRIPGNALYVDNDHGFPLPVKIDKFDRGFVEAVRSAYTALQADKVAPNR